ncbi:MAG: hypothetical protein MZU79_05355 [Anaerotruncus sp.]|nr:hypothetical protein [Anaerotruncus sp.]
MEKRLILAIVLSFLVVLGYQYFFVKAEQACGDAAGPERRRARGPGPGAADAVQEQAGSREARARRARSRPGAGRRSRRGRNGGRGRHARSTGRSGPTRAASSRAGRSSSHKNSRKENLELVPALAARARPLSLLAGPRRRRAGRTPQRRSLFQASGTGLDLADGASGELRFAYSDGASVQAEKIFRFTGGSYAFDDGDPGLEGRPAGLAVRPLGPGDRQPRPPRT